ncbi:MAG TPA: fused response regulator/phosphatase [Deltaproteobacteria bacterium]|nr:fused response regulator/phosphatase [Deltaproteobacteria bacterium]
MPNIPKILVIDDVEVNARVLKHTLENEGFQVGYALSGPGGRMMAENEIPDLILLDIMMPGENGLQTCVQLKANPRTCEIPIIFLSAVDEVQAKVQGLTIGGVDYVTKPFEKEEILARIRLHLRIREAHQMLVEQQRVHLQQLKNAQKAILVDPADLPDAQFAVYYKPLNAVGGEFYDVVKIDEGIFAYFIADISGNDVGAAFVTSAVKALIRQNASPLFTPMETMRTMNSVLGAVLPEGQFVKACYAFLNRRKNELCVVFAGHPPLVFLPAQGRAYPLGKEGDVMGAGELVSFGSQEIRVSRGDRLFLMSDGVLGYREGAPWDQGDGVLAIQRICEQEGSLGLSALMERIVLHAVPEGQKAKDDLLVLGVEV